jgi:hypothetical protein
MKIFIHSFLRIHLDPHIVLELTAGSKLNLFDPNVPRRTVASVKVISSHFFSPFRRSGGNEQRPNFRITQVRPGNPRRL